MAKCQKCRTTKHDKVYKYDSILMCLSCYNKHNIQTYKVYRLPIGYRKALELEIITLEHRIHKIKYQLKIDDQIIKSGKDSLNFLKPNKI